jgi:hypothetical protein
MTMVFGKESTNLYSAFFIPDPVKRKDALDKWVKETIPVIQAAVEEELQSIVELITKDRWTENKWRPAARKLREYQIKHHLVLDVQLRGVSSKDKYKGEVPTPIIPKSEIDLHEKYVQEAIPIIEKYLQESYDACLDRVIIIHGKGIGVLRQAVRDYLQNHRLVKSFAPADKDHGGDGATEVEIIDVITD